MQDPTVGRTYVVTGAQAAPHHLKPGTSARVVRDNAVPATRTRAALPARRWLCRGTSALDGLSIVQWLAAADLEEVATR